MRFFILIQEQQHQQRSNSKDLGSKCLRSKSNTVKSKVETLQLSLKNPNHSLHASESNALITDRLSTRSLTQSVNCHEESWVGHSAIGPELQYILIKPLKNPDILRTEQ